jgi:DNA primase catalytic subunit
MEDNKGEISEKEKRIRAITKIYYSNPRVQEVMVRFAENRESVPRYFEGFGKRPDSIQYPSDIMALVNKGATSFHTSEEIWNDPLKINSDMTLEELGQNRMGWDLLIDIDSPYVDVSKEAAKLVIELFERYGIKNYGLKFSGSKGFHIIVSGKAFPEELEGIKMKNAFPEWPRAITEYMFHSITPEFRRRVGKIMSFSSLEKEKEMKIACKECHRIAVKGDVTKLICPVCSMKIERRDYKLTKRRLKCLSNDCPGVLETIDSEDYYKCENCKDPENDKLQLNSDKYPESFEKIEAVDDYAELDLVLVASRHLFRMPYSLHEKTALASIVLSKEELDNFKLGDANPLNIKIKEYMPQNEKDEAKRLLVDALAWKKSRENEEDKKEKKYENVEYERIDIKDVTDSMFPAPIRKLLKGLEDGKKRGLFILLTFLKCANFTPEEIDKRVREWNKLNKPPLKEGYVKSQLDWHMKQKKKILPPNYDNESFYKDLGLLDKKPEVKNPIVELVREVRKRQR